MTNPDNARALAEEQAVSQAETALLGQEQGIWHRTDAIRLEGATQQRVQALLGRMSSLEQGGISTPDFPKARAVLQSMLASDPPLAPNERAAAVAARRASVQARETALKALAQAMAQLEAMRAAQRRDLEAIDNFIGGAERAASTRAERISTERAATERAAAEQVVAAARAAQEKSAAALAEIQRRAREASVPPMPRPATAPPPVARVPTPPPPPARIVTPPIPAATKAFPSPPHTAPVPPSAGAPQVSTNTRIRKLTRRRRVRLAPPPRKLDVDVAVYGENTFYTGFDNHIASGGLFVSSLETLPAGHELEVSIDLEGRRIQTRGRVEFTRADNTANPECTPGAGIRLLDLPGDAVSAIELFFKKRPPLFMMPHA